MYAKWARVRPVGAAIAVRMRFLACSTSIVAESGESSRQLEREVLRGSRLARLGERHEMGSMVCGLGPHVLVLMLPRREQRVCRFRTYA
jgi:hypothetical protein